MKYAVLLLSILIFVLLPASASGTWLNPTMTSATDPYGVVTQSSEYSTYSAWKVFDHTTTGEGWIVYHADDPMPIWVKYKFQSGVGVDAPAVIDEYRITASGTAARTPKNWTFEGSNTGAFTGEETILNRTIGSTGWTSGLTRTFTFTNTNGYLYYRLNVTANNGDASYSAITELQLWGAFGTGGDTAPPKSITGLGNTTPSCSNISWTWTNPTDPDYSHLYVMKNNAFLTNYTNGTTTALWNALDEHTAYTFSSHTVDLTGNMNTTWVNSTVTTDYCIVPPTPTPTPTPSVTITAVPPAAGAQWCGLQDIWYQHQYSPDVTGYEEWQNYPSGNTQVDENVTVTASDGWVLIDSYITPAGLPNVNVVQPGLRTYHLFGYVENTAGMTYLNATLFKRNTSGGETFIYAVQTNSIESTSVQDNIIAFASPTNLTLDATDRFVSKIYAKTDSAANIKVHFVYQGTSNASYVRSGFFVCPDVCCVPTTAPYVPTIPNLPAAPIKNGLMDIAYGYWWLVVVAVIILWVGRR